MKRTVIGEEFVAEYHNKQCGQIVTYKKSRYIVLFYRHTVITVFRYIVFLKIVILINRFVTYIMKIATNLIANAK